MREVDVEELERALEAGACLVDVREPAEYADAHVAGARLVPMGQLASRLDELDRTEPVYLICRSGNRSGVMAEALAARGFDAVNVTGGMLAWVRAGKPYEQGI